MTFLAVQLCSWRVVKKGGREGAFPERLYVLCSRTKFLTVGALESPFEGVLPCFSYDIDKERGVIGQRPLDRAN